MNIADISSRLIDDIYNIYAINIPSVHGYVYLATCLYVHLANIYLDQLILISSELVSFLLLNATDGMNKLIGLVSKLHVAFCHC